MSNRDDGGALVGLSRRDAAPGMSATSEHVLEERGFDLVAALFGGPGSHGAKLPDAALALLVHGIVLDFVARHLPGPGSDVLTQEIRFTMDPAVGDKVVVSGTLTSRPAEDTAAIALTVDCARGRLAEGTVQVRLPAEPVTLRPEARADIILHHHRHLKQLMDSAARSPALTAAVAWPCDRDSLLGPLQAMRRADEADPGRPARGDREGCCRRRCLPGRRRTSGPRHRSRPRWQRSGSAATAAPRR